VSKYDSFWCILKPTILESLHRAQENGGRVQVPLVGLTELGNRQSWYSHGVVSCYGDNMAHGTSFNKVMRGYEGDFLIEYQINRDGSILTLTIC
jgi:hypothetical protein